MSFTTPAFIRKNTPELREKLEELGYSFVPNGYGEWNVPIDKCEYLKVDSYKSKSYVGGGLYYYTGTVCKPNVDLDCGTNEQLFLALAAKRDDTSSGQYWVFDQDFPPYAKGDFVIGNFIRCSCYCHVATAEELIEHFKNKEK